MVKSRKANDIKVEELRLLNFRSFSNARLTFSRNLTTIIGHNGSGKSTLLDAFDFVRDALSLGLLVAINKRGGLQNIGKRNIVGLPESPSVAVRLNLNSYRVVYGFSIKPSIVEPGVHEARGYTVTHEALSTEDGKNTFSFDRHGFRSSEKVSVANTQSNGSTRKQQSLLLPLLVDQNEVWRDVYKALLGVHTYTFIPASIRSGGRVNSYDYLERDGGNASDILYAVQEQYSEEINRRLASEMKAVEQTETELMVSEWRFQEGEVTEDEVKAKSNELGVLNADLSTKVSAILMNSTLGWIKENIKEVVPDIGGLGVELTDDGRSIIIFNQRAVDTKGDIYYNRFAAAAMSDGTLRSLAILLALRQQPNPTAVLIDEVEDSIHPHALATMISAAYTSTENVQVVITTHSPEVLSYPSIVGDDVRLIEWREGKSEVYTLHPNVLKVLSESRTVGDMLNRNTLRVTDEPLTVDENRFFDVDSKLASSLARSAALWRLDANESASRTR